MCIYSNMWHCTIYKLHTYMTHTCTIEEFFIVLFQREICAFKSVLHGYWVCFLIIRGAVMSETWLLVSATQLLQGKRQCGHISSEYKWEYIILPKGEGELHRTSNIVSRSLRISRNYRKKEKEIWNLKEFLAEMRRSKKKFFLKNLAYGKGRLRDSSISI